MEFLKDSPGKLSAKLFSFKTVRYITGTALIGSSQRSAVGWERTANEYVQASWSEAMNSMIEFWKALGSLPGVADVITGKVTAAKLRERSLLTTAGAQYAIGYAVHLAHEDGIGYGDAVKSLAKLNLDRPRLEGPPPSEEDPIKLEESIFAGNLIDPLTGKVGSGRPAWEAAGDALYQKILEDAGR